MSIKKLEYQIMIIVIVVVSITIDNSNTKRSKNIKLLYETHLIISSKPNTRSLIVFVIPAIGLYVIDIESCMTLVARKFTEFEA